MIALLSGASARSPVKRVDNASSPRFPSSSPDKEQSAARPRMHAPVSHNPAGNTSEFQAPTPSVESPASHATASIIKNVSRPTNSMSHDAGSGLTAGGSKTERAAVVGAESGLRSSSTPGSVASTTAAAVPAEPLVPRDSAVLRQISSLEESVLLLFAQHGLRYTVESAVRVGFGEVTTQYQTERRKLDQRAAGGDQSIRELKSQVSLLEQQEQTLLNAHRQELSERLQKAEDRHKRDVAVQLRSQRERLVSDQQRNLESELARRLSLREAALRDEIRLEEATLRKQELGPRLLQLEQRIANELQSRDEQLQQLQYALADRDQQLSVQGAQIVEYTQQLHVFKQQLGLYEQNVSAEQRQAAALHGELEQLRTALATEARRSRELTDMIARERTEHASELQLVDSRVREAIARRDDKLVALQGQLHSALERLSQTERYLQQQEQELNMMDQIAASASHVRQNLLSTHTSTVSGSGYPLQLLKQKSSQGRQRLVQPASQRPPQSPRTSSPPSQSLLSASLSRTQPVSNGAAAMLQADDPDDDLLDRAQLARELSASLKRPPSSGGAVQNTASTAFAMASGLPNPSETRVVPVAMGQIADSDALVVHDLNGHPLGDSSYEPHVYHDQDQQHQLMHRQVVAVALV